MEDIKKFAKKVYAAMVLLNIDTSQKLSEPAFQSMHAMLMVSLNEDTRKFTELMDTEMNKKIWKLVKKIEKAVNQVCVKDSDDRCSNCKLQGSEECEVLGAGVFTPKEEAQAQDQERLKKELMLKKFHEAKTVEMGDKDFRRFINSLHEDEDQAQAQDPRGGS